MYGRESGNGLVLRGARIGARYVTEACCDVVQFVSTRGVARVVARGCHVTGSGQVECLAVMGRTEEPARAREVRGT